MDFYNIIILIIVIPFAIAGISFAPWVPTRKKDIIRGLALAKIKPNEIFYELGCGDGRVSFFANEKYKTKTIGIELCFYLFIICKIKQFFLKRKDIEFRNKNLYKVDLKDADVIYMYGMPDKLKRLTEKFKKELKPKTRIISYIFEIEGLTPKKIDKPTPQDLTIYLYEM